MATLARGGRLNFFGFVLRLAARLPFLFIAGRIYGAAALGRFAYAVLIVEFAAQLATLGLKRGLAQLLANAKKPHVCVVADALLVAAIGSAIGMAHPDRSSRRRCSRPRRITGLESAACRSPSSRSPGPTSRWPRSPITTTSASTVRARSIVEPWTISIAAFAWSFISTARRADHRLRLLDGRGAGRVADPAPAKATACRTAGSPDLAAAVADGAAQRAAGRRRRGRMGVAPDRHRRARRCSFSPSVVGIYYVAQQVAIAAGQAEDQLRPDARPGDRPQHRGRRPAGGRQAGAAGRASGSSPRSSAIALALGIPGEAVMGLVGSGFIGGTAMLGLPARRRSDRRRRPSSAKRR